MSSKLPLLNMENLPTAPFFSEHMWVDYVELLCLVNLDQQISKADITDRIRERKDLGETEEENEDSPAEANDKWSVRSNDWYRHLSYRMAAFGQFYPFYLDSNQNILHLHSAVTVEHRLYLFLLIAANSRYLRRKSNEFRDEFEIISSQVMKNCLPEEAEVHIFGTNPRNVGRYNIPHIWDRINKLADDLKETVKISKEKFAETDRGDGGLDLVGWVPAGDSVNRFPVVFGQCACSPTEWEQKQFTATDYAWRGTIALDVGPSTMTFIPQCLRDADGTWHAPHRIGTLLMDRLRIIHFLRRDYTLIRDLTSYELIAEVIAIDESIF